MGDFLIMGSGEEQNNMRENETALADAFEAVVGAVWLDSGKNYYCWFFICWFFIFTLSNYCVTIFTVFNMDLV